MIFQNSSTDQQGDKQENTLDIHEYYKTYFYSSNEIRKSQNEHESLTKNPPKQEKNVLKQEKYVTKQEKYITKQEKMLQNRKRCCKKGNPVSAPSLILTEK